MGRIEGGKQMIVAFLIELLIGLLCIGLGLLIWLKRKLSLVNESQCQHVKTTDIPAYTRLIGIGLMVIGTGVCLTGVLNLYWSPLWWIPLLVGIASGIAVFAKAQKKYNNGAWV